MAKKAIINEEEPTGDIVMQENITAEEQAYAESRLEEDMKKWDGHVSRAYRSANPIPTVAPEVTSEPAENGGQEEA